MNKILSDLWNGNFVPIKNFGMDNAQIRELEQKMSKSIELLENILSNSGEQLFKNYYDLINEYLIVCIEQAFCDGFSAGTELLIEARSNAKSIF